jgi:hypothetical protein
MFNVIKNIVQCDICTSSFPIFPLEDIVPPPNWYIVYHGSGQLFADARHFCSDTCLLQHFGAIPAVHVQASGGGHIKGGKR